MTEKIDREVKGGKMGQHLTITQATVYKLHKRGIQTAMAISLRKKRRDH